MSSAAQLSLTGNVRAPAVPRPADGRACLPPTLAALAWHVLLLVGFVAPFGGDPSALVCVRRPEVGRWPYEAVHVGFGEDGFDGQFYYALARNPWRWHHEALDFPSYRHLRILYPALAWLLSGGGQPRALLWALPAINVLSAAGLAWLGALLAVRHGRSAWWGFLLPVVVNVGMAALRDLTDPLAALCACGLLAAWLLRWRPAVVFAWAAAAVFSREQNVAVALIVLLAALHHGRRRHAAALAAALLLLAGWVVLLRGAYGTWPLARGNLGVPLAAMLERFSQPMRSRHASSVVLEVVRRLVVPLQVVLCVALAFRRGNRSLKLVALAGALLAVVAGGQVYGDEWSYLRVFYWMPLAVWIASATGGPRWPVLLMCPVLLCPSLPVCHGLRSLLTK
jgi:hypothetical protein